jgi:hypothetical protein
MSKRLLVAVLAPRKSGKSTTWNTLFGKKVRSGKHQIKFNNESIEVYLIAGSPQERKIKVEDLLPKDLPIIVLCSIQYVDDARNTFNYFWENDYFLFVHWLNPGYQHNCPINDPEGLMDWLLSFESLVGIRDGRINPQTRVQNMKDFIYGWAKKRGLVNQKS